MRRAQNLAGEGTGLARLTHSCQNCLHAGVPSTAQLGSKCKRISSRKEERRLHLHSLHVARGPRLHAKVCYGGSLPPPPPTIAPTSLIKEYVAKRKKKVTKNRPTRRMTRRYVGNLDTHSKLNESLVCANSFGLLRWGHSKDSEFFRFSSCKSSLF